MTGSVSVVGLGRIGLPLALSYCERGFRVIGVDADVQRVEGLFRGCTETMEMHHGIHLSNILTKHLRSGSFIPTTRYGLAALETDAYVVAVDGTDAVGESPLVSAVEQLGAVLKRNDLVLIRSAVVPGMVEHAFIPTLERASRLRAGAEFHLAYAVQPVTMGRAITELHTRDVVLGGLTERCTAAAAELVTRLTSGTVHIMDLRTAQAAGLSDRLQQDVGTTLVHRGSHADMPMVLAEQLEARLRRAGKRFEDAVVAILGLGEQDNSGVVRNSPAVALAYILHAKGAVVRAYDPLVPLQFPFQTKTFKEAMYGSDGLVVAVWHDLFAQLDFAAAFAVSDVRNVVIDPRRRLLHHLLSAWRVKPIDVL